MSSEASKQCQDTSIDEDFLSNHLRQPPPRACWLKGAAKPYIAEIEDGGSISGNLYEPLRGMLNEYSTRVHGKLPKRAREIENAYHFLAYYDNIPSHHPFQINHRPDILVVEGDDYNNVSYCKVVSVIECKPDKGNGRAQEASYMSLHMDARPDMPGVYGLWARPQGYQVLWSDASGVTASPQSSWDNCELLAAYVYSLYDPPDNHILFDQTITASNQVPEAPARARWTIKGHLKDAYRDCEWIFIGSSWGRRTNVWKHEIEGKGPVVVKDAYRDNRRQYEEETLINKIHSKGILPGVVRTLEPAEDYPEITTVSSTKKRRTKTRLIMGSYGESLLRAKSVKDLLMAVYDIVEVHRKLVMDSQILHRDISLNNVMMYPRHHPDAMKCKELIAKPPKFIKEVLPKGTVVPIQGPDKSMGLLIDFDNGADLSEACVTQRELVFRTGTPRFIARSVAAGAALGLDTNFYSMPTLDGDTKTCYLDAYGPEAYERYPNDNGVDIIHGAKFTSSEDVHRDFVHRPDHDVESIFWVLLYVLIIAQPEDDSGTWNKTRNEEAYSCFQNHTIKKDATADTRNIILGWKKVVLASALDPKFRSLAPMLYEMRLQIAPEYADLDEEPPKDHLHEAMRRLLLRYILKMKDPIPLNPNVELLEKRGAGGSGAGGRSSKKSRSILEENLMSMRRFSEVV